jgi:hypothetical protein
VHLYLGAGDGTFQDGPVVPVGERPTFAVAADFNDDNWGDIAVVDNPINGNNARAWVLEQVPGNGDATGPNVALTAPSAGSVLLGSVTVTATATDATSMRLSMLAITTSEEGPRGSFQSSKSPQVLKKSSALRTTGRYASIQIDTQRTQKTCSDVV